MLKQKKLTSDSLTIQIPTSRGTLALLFLLSFITAAALSALLIYLLHQFVLPDLTPGSLARDYVVSAVSSLVVVAAVFLLLKHLRNAEILLSPSERKYQAIIAQTPVCICVTSAQGTAFVSANPAACDALGYRQEELMTLGPQDIVARHDLLQQSLQLDALRTGESLNTERLFQRKNGSIFPAQAIFTRMEDGCLLCTFIDISQRKSLEQGLIEERNFADRMIQSLPGVFYLFDESGKFLRWNENMELVTGYSSEEIESLHPLDLIPPEDKEYVAGQIAEVFLSGSAVADASLITKYGLKIPYFFTGVRARFGEVDCLVGMGIDATERRAAEQQIQYLAYYDALTGLPNRVLFRENLNHALAVAQRTGEQLAVMFIDLDFFKEVNDTFGHECGDRVLKEAAARISSSLRTIDSVSRLGGDEFLTLLQGISGPDDTVLVAGKILDTLAEPFEVDDHRIMLSSSIGIAIYPEHGDDMHSLIEAADKAMYMAKNAGRNSFCLYIA